MEITAEQWEGIISEVVRLFIVSEIVRKNVSATGRTEKSLKPRHNLLYGVDYSEYADRGRGPARFKRTGKPTGAKSSKIIEGLQEWVRVKLGITDPKENLSTAFAIAKTIEEKGTLNHREGGYSRFLYVLNTRRVVQYVQKEVSKILSKKAEAIITTSFKTKIK